MTSSLNILCTLQQTQGVAHPEPLAVLWAMGTLGCGPLVNRPGDVQGKPAAGTIWSTRLQVPNTYFAELTAAAAAPVHWRLSVP